MLTKHALLSHSYGDDSKMALFVKIGPRGAEFLALRTDRDSRLLIQIEDSKHQKYADPDPGHNSWLTQNLKYISKLDYQCFQQSIIDLRCKILIVYTSIFKFLYIFGLFLLCIFKIRCVFLVFGSGFGSSDHKGCGSRFGSTALLYKQHGPQNKQKFSKCRLPNE